LSPPLPAVAEMSLPKLSSDEIARYSRHLILDEVGMEGQRKLKGASVLCVGTGGLGSPLLMYLAAAGIGRIGIVDFDVVDESNLQRQIIHGTKDVGRPKVASAHDTIKDINPNVELDIFEEPLTSENALRILGPYDVVVDGTDNFPTRYLVNDACVMLGKPNVYGSIFKFEGQASVFNYQGGPQYRDLYPEPPPPGLVPSCAEGGVLGILPGIIGVIQATETVKILLGQGTTLSGRLLLYDAMNMRFRELKLRKDPNSKPITELIDYQQFCGIPGIEHAEEEDTVFQSIDVATAKQKLDDGWAPFVLDVRRPMEADIVKLAFADRLEPHGSVATIADDLPRDRDILVHCKMGGRSAQACATLASLGFDASRVYNLGGGITAWAQQIDTSLPTY
jgi:sulfur-carrier protein adenylyltransferase/sulfurtransferase